MKILLSVNLNKNNYIEAVTGCGAQAVAEYCPKYSDEYDGLILCGGNDISPSYYGEEINGSKDIDDVRDKAEFELADKFIKSGKPVMGICRGYQLLNIYFGGSLYQDIENSSLHRSTTEGDAFHKSTANEGSILHSLYGKEFIVNSAHHQAIKKAGEGIVVTSFAQDGTADAFEHSSLAVIGVQWHPERVCFGKGSKDAVDGAEIIRYFIKMCQKNRR